MGGVSIKTMQFVDGIVGKGYRMAEFQKIAKASKRMCNFYEVCEECPINKIRGNAICMSWIMLNPEKTEPIILKWASEHPIITNRMKFKDVFGFEFTDRVPESQYHREWLDKEYEEPSDA